MLKTTLHMARIDARSGDAQAALNRLHRLRGDRVTESGRHRTVELFGEPLSPSEVVERICRDVRERGLEAVLEYSRRIDKADLDASSLRVPSHELDLAHSQADEEFLATVRRVRTRIVQFQAGILHRDAVLPQSGKFELRQRYRPLRRVGVCVPGGAAAYPSTLLMTAVPAQVAGVSEVAVVVPPTEFGGYNIPLLAAARELGIREVYRVGGAQGVAALAYGVEGIERVQKIVGPGNLFVALAKRFVFGHVAIDAIAGPSEVVVLADRTARPQYVASDLISQAEHAPGASLLITWHEPLLDAVQAAVADQLDRLARAAEARESLEAFGAMVLVAGEEQGARLADEIAPEHLHIATDDPERILARIENAGAVFLGHHTPVAVGDYAAGPSHVLPTGGTARFAQGLTVNDFLRGMSVLKFTPEGLAEIARDVRCLAAIEGLTGHSSSVDLRLDAHAGR